MPTSLVAFWHNTAAEYWAKRWMYYTSIDYIYRMYEFICKFSASAITRFKNLVWTATKKSWMFHKGQSLCSHRNSRALFGAPKWCMKQSLGRIALHFVSLNSLVMIWVHPETSTDLQHNLFPFKYEKRQQTVFGRLLEGQKEKETRFPKKRFVRRQQR